MLYSYSNIDFTVKWFKQLNTSTFRKEAEAQIKEMIYPNILVVHKIAYMWIEKLDDMKCYIKITSNVTYNCY